MPPDGTAHILDETPFCMARIGADGVIQEATRAFQQATGLAPGAPAPPWAGGDGQPLVLGARQYEVWSKPMESARLVALVDRTEVVELEDRLWEQQTRLSKAYSELSASNQTMTAALDKLRQREEELTALNRGLEERVASQISELERSNRLRRYLSPDVADSIVNSDGAELGTRKRVLSVLFADIGTFDELVAELESEEVIDILNAYRREMTAILFEHGGTLDKFIAARIMAFFGDPIPHEDHAVRAVRTAVAMREKVAAMRNRWFPQASGVDFRAAVHTGYATVGNVGSDQRVDYTVIGKNVALASALEQEAKPGQVLVSARTFEAVKERFDFDAVQIALKGGSRPVAAYELRRERSESAIDTRGVERTELQPRDAPRSAIEGSRLGPYLVQEKIGEGGMGMVYRALDDRLQRPVALKVLPPELASDESFVTRFVREAQALASLNSPYVAQVYYISDDERPMFFAMELIEGPTLRRVLLDQGRLPMRRSLDLATQMAKGLQAAFEKGVIHRDVKPENVMLTLKGQVKLTDFGLVKRTHGEPGVTSRGVVLGTPLYMSPEQGRGEEVDLRSDIYALGCTLFHMLSGQPPFSGDSAIAVLRKHEVSELPALATLPGTISPSVYAMLRCMMAKHADERYQTYDAVIQALEGA